MPFPTQSPCLTLTKEQLLFSVFTPLISCACSRTSYKCSHTVSIILCEVSSTQPVFENHSCAYFSSSFLIGILSSKYITIHFIHSPIDGHFGCFHIKAIRKKSSHERVKNCAGPAVLPHLQDSLLPIFMDASRRCKTPKSDKVFYCTQ